jgi:putative membrane protein
MKKEEKPKDIITKAALVRTMFSAENSMMAWVRTSVSLYAFGFSIITFFDYLGQQSDNNRTMTIPFVLGFALICIGIISLLLAMAEHKKVRVRLKELGLPSFSRYSLPIGSAIALLVIGSFALIAIIVHISI